MRESSRFALLANPYLEHVKPYVPGLTTQEAAERYQVPVEKIVKLSSNENPLGPPPLAVQALRDMLSQLHRYPDSKALALRTRLADAEGLTPDNVIIGAGSSEIMSFIIRAFSQVGDEVVSMDPSFTAYSELALADGRAPALAPLQHPFQLRMQDVRNVLTERTRVIFITRPNNPTSRLVPITLFEEIARLASNAIVVSDEAYIEFVDNYRDQTAASLITRMDNVLLTRTFSKAYGIPNLRVGYALGPKDAIDYLFKIKPKWNVGGVAQQAAIGALNDKQHFERTLSVVEVERRYVAEQLTKIDGLDILPEPQANFVMVKVEGTGLSAPAFTEALGAHGVIIRGDFHPDYVRISIGTRTENDALLEAVREVLRRL